MTTSHRWITGVIGVTEKLPEESLGSCDEVDPALAEAKSQRMVIEIIGDWTFIMNLIINCY